MIAVVVILYRKRAKENDKIREIGWDDVIALPRVVLNDLYRRSTVGHARRSSLTSKPIDDALLTGTQSARFEDAGSEGNSMERPGSRRMLISPRRSRRSYHGDGLSVSNHSNEFNDDVTDTGSH